MLKTPITALTEGRGGPPQRDDRQRPLWAWRRFVPSHRASLGCSISRGATSLVLQPRSTAWLARGSPPQPPPRAHPAYIPAPVALGCG